MLALSTGGIVALAIVAALVLIVALVLVPRIGQVRAQRRLQGRRNQAADHHRSEAEARRARAELAEREAQKARSEADIHEQEAALHERGLADERLDDDSAATGGTRFPRDRDRGDVPAERDADVADRDRVR